MIEKKYTKDLELIDHKKLKGRKILKKFMIDLYHFSKKTDNDVHSKYSEREEFMIVNSSFYYRMASIYNMMKNKDTKFRLYKNVYDDFFIYLSSYDSKNSIKDETLICLDEKNQINLKKDNISIIDSRTRGSYHQDITVSFHSINSANTLHYPHNKDKPRYHYDVCLDKEDYCYDISYGNNERMQKIHYNHFKDNISFYLMKFSSNSPSIDFNYTYKNKDIEAFFDKDYFSIELFLNMGSENESTIFRIEQHQNPDFSMDFNIIVKNNSDLNKFSKIEDFFDFLPIMKDINLDKNEVLFYKQIYSGLLAFHGFLKNAYLTEKLIPDEFILKFNDIQLVEHTLPKIQQKTNTNLIKKNNLC